MIDQTKISYFKDEDGATAVEFALIGIPFIFMIVGIIEMAMVFTAQSLLEASMSQAAREIRTGQIQQGGGELDFQDTICGYAAILIPCDQIQYQVVSLDDFASAEDFPDATFDEDGNLENQSFDAGGASDVVLVRTVYAYPIMTPLFQPVLANNGAFRRTLMSTMVLQTEPYVWGAE